MAICKRCGKEDEGFNFTFHECDEKAKTGGGPKTLYDAIDLAREERTGKIDPEFRDGAERIRVVALLASQTAIIRTALATILNIRMGHPMFIKQFYDQMPYPYELCGGTLGEWINFANQADDNLVKPEVLYYKG